MIGRRIRAHLLRDLAPATFMQPFIEGMLYESDPRFAQVRQSGFPVAWRLDEIEAAAQGSGDRKMLALAGHLRAHAMNSGVLFGLSAPRLDLRVAVNVTSETHGTEWIDDRVIGGALSVSLAVHRVALPFLEARIARMRGFALGDEQQQVLDRLVHGLSDQEIASALRTSLHKVGHHIRSLENSSTCRTARNSRIWRRAGCRPDAVSSPFSPRDPVTVAGPPVAGPTGRLRPRRRRDAHATLDSAFE